jgi:hypothetical protein
MQIEIRENVSRPAWNSRRLDGKPEGKTAKLPGKTLGFDDTFAFTGNVKEEVKK